MKFLADPIQTTLLTSKSAPSRYLKATAPQFLHISTKGSLGLLRSSALSIQKQRSNHIPQLLCLLNPRGMEVTSGYNVYLSFSKTNTLRRGNHFVVHEESHLCRRVKGEAQKGQWLQLILQSYSNQNSMVLAQRPTHRSMGQNKVQKEIHALMVNNLQQSMQEYTMQKGQSLQVVWGKMDSYTWN